jgi:hypothetical protein
VDLRGADQREQLLELAVQERVLEQVPPSSGVTPARW